MAGAPYQIGIASVDITPPLGVILSGYGPRKGVADEVGHKLRAEALVVKGQDGGAWALLTTDIAGYPHDVVAQIRAAVAAKCSLKSEQIAITATHTHSGPGGLACYNEKLGDVDHAWRKATVPKLSQVIVDAFQAAEPGAFEVAMTEAPLLGSNRRVVAADGTATNDWQDPDGKHTGYFDPSVMVVGVRRPSGKLAAVIVNYGCHPVTLGPRSLAISADYPGYMKDTVEAAHPGATVLFALGGAGNINPRDAIDVGAQWPTKVGTALGRIVNAAIAKLRPVAAGPVRSCQVPWKMLSRRAWSEKSDRRTDAEITTEVQAFRAGDLVLTMIPGELFSEFVGWIRKASPLSATMVVSMANDTAGYLPVDEAMPQGGHEVRFRATDLVEKPLLQHVADAVKRVTA
jgi:hypothetical protein